MDKPTETKFTWEIETSGSAGVFPRFEISRNTSSRPKASSIPWYNFVTKNGHGYELRELAQLRDWLSDFLEAEGYVSVKLT